MSHTSFSFAEEGGPEASHPAAGEDEVRAGEDEKEGAMWETGFRALVWTGGESNARGQGGGGTGDNPCTSTMRLTLSILSKIRGRTGRSSSSGRYRFPCSNSSKHSLFKNLIQSYFLKKSLIKNSYFNK